MIVLGVNLSLGVLNATAETRFSAGLEINAVSDFYAPLSSEGSWVDVSSYGRCWHPRVAAGWRPYTTGHWNGPMSAGTGSVMSHGPGRVTITAHGSMTHPMGGSGYLELSGHQPG